MSLSAMRCAEKAKSQRQAKSPKRVKSAISGVWTDRLLRNKRQLARLLHRLGAALHVELVIKAGHLSLDGVWRNAELLRDLLVGLASGQQPQHLLFTLRDAQRRHRRGVFLKRFGGGTAGQAQPRPNSQRRECERDQGDIDFE